MSEFGYTLPFRDWPRHDRCWAAERTSLWAGLDSPEVTLAV